MATPRYLRQKVISRGLSRNGIDLDPGPGVSTEAPMYPWFASPVEVDRSINQAVDAVLGRVVPRGNLRSSGTER